jgi:hypothetical protein
MALENHDFAMSLDARLDVRVGEAVEFEFTVTNPTTERVELSSPDGRTVDVVVQSDGEEIWRWSRGREFAGGSRADTLAPGEQARQTAVWEDPRPGSYTAVATLGADVGAVSARNEFQVERSARR